MAHHARDVAKEQRWRDRLAEQAASTLEQGEFHFPTDGTTAVEIPRAELLKLLAGAHVTPLKKV